MHSDALCLIIKKEHLEFLNEKCYSKEKEQPPTKWFGLKECNIENATPLLAKVSGVVFLLLLHKAERTDVYRKVESGFT